MNRTRMFLRMVLSSFVHRLSRVIIASMSILVGAATLSGLALLTFTVPDQMAREMRSYGANLIIMPRGTNMLTTEDMTKINTKIKQAGNEIIGSAPYRYESVIYNHMPVPAVGTDLSKVYSVRPYWIIDGAKANHPGQMLLGIDQVHRFNLEDGAELEITSKDGSDKAVKKNIKITGKLRTGGKEDSLMVMSMSDLNAITGGKNRIDVVEYSLIGNTNSLTKISQEINNAFPKANAQVVKRITQSESGVLKTLQSLILIVSIIVCVLTMIGVSTTMNSIVNERATEIGLKKALGASNKAVFAEFFGEAIALGLFGGFIGATLGYFFASFVTRQVFSRSLEMNWLTFPVTMLLAAIVSGLGSMISARRVTRIRPAEVLGGE